METGMSNRIHTGQENTSTTYRIDEISTRLHRDDHSRLECTSCAEASQTCFVAANRAGGIAYKYKNENLFQENQSINRSVDQWINQSINRWTNQSINQSVDKSINQSISGSINQSIDRWTVRNLPPTSWTSTPRKWPVKWWKTKINFSR